MSKKVFYSILLPALLLIGGYIALQVYLRTGTSGEGEGKPEQLVTTQRSTAQSSVTPQTGTADTATKKATRPGEKKTSTKAEKTVEENDSADKEKSSPLDLGPLFIDKLQQLVKKSSNGLYNLSVGKLEMDVLASTVALHKVALRPDEHAVQRLKEAGRLPQSVVSLSFEDLLIDGINIDDAINSKSMDYNVIKLVNPVVEIDRYQVGNNENSSGNFSQGFLQQMEKLAIGKLQVEGGTITVYDKTKGGAKKLENVQVLMQDILLSDATRNDKERFLFAKQAQLEFHDFKMPVQNGLYNFTIGDAFIHATQKRVELKNISYSSPLSKEAFVAKQEKAAEKYDLSLSLLTIDGVDWWPVLNGEKISAGEVETKDGKLAIYFDRSLPAENKMGNFPNQMLEKLSMQVDVGKLKVQNFDIAYEEYNPTSKQSGTIYFDDVTMKINNISNAQSNNKPMEVDGSALVMHQVPLNATIIFSMEKAKEGVFSASLKLDSFKAEVMNPAAEPLGMIKADRGSVHTIDVSMQGNETAASGEVLMLYDKLKLSLLEKNKHDDGLNKRHLISFIANVFVLKNDNPWWLTGKKRKKEVYFERDPEAGFLSLVWKTAFVGLLKTVGAPEKIVKKE